MGVFVEKKVKGKKLCTMEMLQIEEKVNSSCSRKNVVFAAEFFLIYVVVVSLLILKWYSRNELPINDVCKNKRGCKRYFQA